jgi:hypothetical protein
LFVGLFFKNYDLKLVLLFFFYVACITTTKGQTDIWLTNQGNDSTGSKLTVGAMVDAYYGFDFNKPDDRNRPYFVSMHRHNEFSINMAYVDLAYSSPRVRGRFAPGFGTYLNANYANEPGTLKNILEASAGIKLFKNRSIWLDAGIFDSPISSEGAVSKSQITLTRSYASENVPYYLAGVKLQLPLSKKLTAHLYAVNGWQQIQDVNSSKSVITQLAYTPTSEWLINWNVYVGNEQSTANPNFGMRYFTDVYAICSLERWTISGSAFIGLQERYSEDDAPWWQTNLIASYAIAKPCSIIGRIEYFSDAETAIITPITGNSSFSTAGASLGVEFRIASHAMLRFEGRGFFSNESVFLRNQEEVNNSMLLISNLIVWF